MTVVLGATNNTADTIDFVFDNNTNAGDWDPAWVNDDSQSPAQADTVIQINGTTLRFTGPGWPPTLTGDNWSFTNQPADVAPGQSGIVL